MKETLSEKYEEKEYSKKRFRSFNKEILFGELGSLFAAPTISSLISQVSSNVKIISLSAVFGAIIGASLFWLIMRIYDRKKRDELTMAGMTNDFIYLTPGASMLTLLVYYPTLYSLSYNNIISGRYGVAISVIISQVIAFSMFLIAINIYRIVLKKFFNKML
jgi:hypothetical protein